MSRPRVFHRQSGDGPAGNVCRPVGNFGTGVLSVRRGIGDQIEILRLAPEKEVTDAAADQVGFEAVVPEAVERSQGVGAEHLSGDGVLVPRDYDRLLWFHSSQNTISLAKSKIPYKSGPVCYNATCNVLSQCGLYALTLSWRSSMFGWLTGKYCTPCGIRKQRGCV